MHANADLGEIPIYALDMKVMTVCVAVVVALGCSSSEPSRAELQQRKAKALERNIHKAGGVATLDAKGTAGEILVISGEGCSQDMLVTWATMGLRDQGFEILECAGPSGPLRMSLVGAEK